jgi:hypothetical protein
MKETLYEELEPGKTYYIECLTEDENKNYIRNMSIEKLIATFVKYEEIEYSNGFKFAFFKEFRSIREDVRKGYDVRLGLLWKFYEVLKHKIQNNMEERGCNLILQNIIGDPYFLY